MQIHGQSHTRVDSHGNANGRRIDSGAAKEGGRVKCNVSHTRETPSHIVASRVRSSGDVISCMRNAATVAVSSPHSSLGWSHNAAQSESGTRSRINPGLRSLSSTIDSGWCPRVSTLVPPHPRHTYTTRAAGPRSTIDASQCHGPHCNHTSSRSSPVKVHGKLCTMPLSRHPAALPGIHGGGP